jgi:hypothetical protein
MSWHIAIRHHFFLAAPNFSTLPYHHELQTINDLLPGYLYDSIVPLGSLSMGVILESERGNMPRR